MYIADDTKCHKNEKVISVLLILAMLVSFGRIFPGKKETPQTGLMSGLS
jgi:hypothetical protein